MRVIRRNAGDWVADEACTRGRQMPTLASALVVQARQRTGLTQAELAERVGTSRTAISAIEHGRRDPGLEHLQAILRAAGLDLLTQLVAHDDHDEVLEALGAGPDAEPCQAPDRAMGECGDELREAMAHARPLVER
ncbi:MAG: helix-turn-helix transcriptional regulator [Actinomycetota bacterium]|nr:helix-turn-helix transcriptional regulator [Actinomycetota bacterium]